MSTERPDAAEASKGTPIEDMSIEEIVKHLKGRMKYTTLIGTTGKGLEVWSETRSMMELEGTLHAALNQVERNIHIGL